jgi:hypothetical protein
VALKSYRDFEKAISPLLKSLKAQNRVIGVLLANLRITSGLPGVQYRCQAWRSLPTSVYHY